MYPSGLILRISLLTAWALTTSEIHIDAFHSHQSCHLLKKACQSRRRRSFTFATPSPSSDKTLPLSGLYKSYVNWLEEKPLISNAVSASVINGIGDVLAQVVECKGHRKHVFPLDLTRLLAFAVAGFVFVGPYMYLFYSQLWKLGSWLQQRYGMSRRRPIVVQVILDQTLGIALFYPLYYFVFEYSQAILGLRNLAPVAAAAATKMKQEIKSVLVINWIVWIPFNYLNFTIIPERHRILIINVFSVFWNAFLCTRVAQ